MDQQITRNEVARNYTSALDSILDPLRDCEIDRLRMFISAYRGRCGEQFEPFHKNIALALDNALFLIEHPEGE